MGTWTHLTPTIFCYKLHEVLIESSAPLLWCSLFSPDDIFVDKDNVGDSYALNKRS